LSIAVEWIRTVPHVATRRKYRGIQGLHWLWQLHACGLLAREPRRRERTPQRTSFALEALVGEDCDRCDNCVLVCPQVDTTIKHYIVNTRMVEGMARLLKKVDSDEETLWALGA
jgi:ferredoxin